MVKRECREQFLPACGCVTVFAALLERTFMRIDVAVRANRKLHVFVACWTTRHIGLVALLAGNLNVRAG